MVFLEKLRLAKAFFYLTAARGAFFLRMWRSGKFEFETPSLTPSDCKFEKNRRKNIDKNVFTVIQYRKCTFRGTKINSCFNLEDA
jgi:hypothetical protein